MLNESPRKTKSQRKGRKENIKKETKKKQAKKKEKTRYKIEKEIIENTIITSNQSKYWFINAWIIVDNNKYQLIKLMADTGATLCVINEQFARKYYPKQIKSLARSLTAFTCGKKPLKLNHYIDLKFINPSNKQLITTIEFYLIPNTSVNFIASHYLLNKLGYKFSKIPPKYKSYEHTPEQDTNFGTCNRWDEPRMQIKAPKKQIKTKARAKDKSNIYNIAQAIQNDDDSHLLKTPYQEYIDACETPMQTVANAQINQITFIKAKNKIFKILPKYSLLLHISNFGASEEELKKIKQLTKDRPLKATPMEHIKNISTKLYTKTIKLLQTKYHKLFAKYQSQRRIIPKWEFKIDLIPEAKNEVIFKPQYPLNEEKRLVFIHHTKMNIRNGMFVPNNTSPHNVPAIIIKRKDGRLRLAYDLTKLNAKTTTVQSHIPTYNYLFEKLRGKGKFSVTDAKNFFEGISLRHKDRDLVHVTTPIGEYNITCGTYGFKNISTMAQDIVNRIIKPLPRAGAFIDDIFIKHNPDASDDELLNDITTLFDRINDAGLLLHPEKTYLFVDEIEFLGYLFTQEGTIPQRKYIQKVLKFKRPTNKKEIQSYLGTVQYIARYLYKLAEWSQALNKLTQADCKAKWGKEQDYAFDQIQKQVNNIKLLSHPTPNGTFLVQCDASKYAISGVLYQRQYSTQHNRYIWKLIEFYSKQVDKSLLHHPIMVKECLAIVYSVTHWQHFLLRKMFYLDTDHKNIIHLYDDDEQKAANMRKKQIFITMQYALLPYHFKIAHISGDKIPFADYLSRDGNKYNDMEINLISPQYNTQFDRLNYLRTYDHINAIRHITNKIDTEPVLPIISIKQVSSHSNTIHKNHKLYLSDSNTFRNVIHNIFTKDHYLQNHSKNIAIRWIKENKKQIKYTPEQAAVNAIKNPPKSILKNKKTSKSTKIYANYVQIYNTNEKNREDMLDNSIILAQINTIRNMNLFKNHKVTSNMIYNIKRNINELYEHKRKRNVIQNSKKQKYLTPIQRINKYIKYNNHNNNQINQIEDPNYYVNESGLRRSLRTTKQAKTFYDESNESQEEQKTDTIPKKGIKDAKENKTCQKSTCPKSNSCTQKYTQQHSNPKSTHTQDSLVYNEKKREKKIPTNINDIFTHTLATVNEPDKAQQVLQPENILNEQQIDLICINIRAAIQHNTHNSPYFQTYFRFIHNLIKSNAFYIADNNLLCIKADKKHPKPRVVLPVKLIKTAIEYIHKSTHRNHPGIQQTQKQIEQIYWWYKYNTDVRNYVNTCHECQITKGSKRYNIGKLIPLNANTHGEIVHFDFAGPFHKKLNILVMVDNYTGAVMFKATKSQTAQEVVRCLMNEWMPYHGLPRNFITDRGAGFIAEINQRICKIIGIKKLFTSRYHPQTNGKAERMVQELKKQLRILNIQLNNTLTNNYTPAQQNLAIKQIKILLPSIQFACNQRIRHFSNTSPHQMLYGSNLPTIEDVALKINQLNELRDNIKKDKSYKSKYQLITELTQQLSILQSQFNKDKQKYIIIMKRNFDKHKTKEPKEQFKIGDYVAYYIGDRANTTRKLRQRFTGPWQIIEQLNENTYKIANKDATISMCCHVQMLKKYNKDHFTPLINYEQSEKEKRKIQNRQRSKKKANKVPNTRTSHKQDNKNKE